MCETEKPKKQKYHGASLPVPHVWYALAKAMECIHMFCSAYLHFSDWFGTVESTITTILINIDGNFYWYN